MGILIYVAYMNYVDYYSYNISSEDESSTKALLSLGIKRNHELTSFTLYAKYDEDNIEYIGQNVLLDRTDILEKIQKVDTDGLKVDYHLTSIPYDRIIDYEAIKFDLKKVSLREIDNIVDYLDKTGDVEPVKDIDMCCEEPYKCAYYDYCSRHLPSPSVFDINRLKKAKKYEYYHNGIVSFEDVFMKAPKLSDKQWIQIDAEYKNLPPHIVVQECIDKLGIKSCLEQYTYPIYYLDFETYQQPVPMFDDSRPYQQIPFQYSLHIQYEKGGELEHREFLGDPTKDPRRALCEQMCHDIPKDACVLVYNESFEKTRIREMAADLPDLAEDLMRIHDSIKDLMLPFQKKYFYLIF